MITEIRAKIENFRGIKSADIKLDKLTIIAGKNRQGKTSIAMAIAAALSGKSVPLDITKKQAAMLVNNDAKKGRVEVSHQDGVTTIEYPSAEKRTEGVPLEISEVAAGLDSLVNYKPKDLSAQLGEMLDFSVARDDVAAQLPDVPAESIGKIYKTIEIAGWDTAWKQAKEKGQELKGAWKQITGGESYGVQKAAEWEPDAYDNAVKNATLDHLQKKYQEEKEFYHVAISNVAVSDAEVQALKETVDAASGLDVSFFDGEIDGLQKNESDIAGQIPKMPSPEQPAVCSCPHCKKPVQIDGDALIVPKQITDQEAEKRQAAIDDAKKSLADIREKIANLQGKRQEIASKITAAKAAAEKLKKAKRSNNSEDAVEECRKHMDLAKARLDAFTEKQNADSKHRSIVLNQQIIDVLAPDGLRKTKLIDALGGFNGTCADLCRVAGWHAVAIDSDMSITLGGRPYALLSKSERWIVRTVLQVAVAISDGSSVVIIDDADEVVGEADQKGAIKMLLAANTAHGTAAILCIARREPLGEGVKKIAKTYWIENGGCQ